MNATVNHDTHVAHIEAVVARQRTFFETGATRPVAVRVAALRRLKKEMQKREKMEPRISWVVISPVISPR